ncbi:MAG: DNA adenine methylase [Thermogemmatispora sp.]|uniref:DNA methyltransferase n=1 Tax=Thermogemmatispora sp. TaxID=1968838 RepID=UPI0026363A06|nr:DNA methyltransferase [Thermogemmatispora sp.]MBX5457908.1 DNA adenine methylase [Thermogemmatispora sp.]
MHQKSSQSSLEVAIEKSVSRGIFLSSASLLEQATISLQEGWRTSAGHLDLKRRERTSLFPWRGQFSPQLVELLLQRYAERSAVVLDPFVGSGTTLFEAARQGLSCYAADINPAAVALARTAYFVRLPPSERQHLIVKAESLLKKAMRPAFTDLFSFLEHLECEIDNYTLSEEEAILPLIRDTEDQLIRIILINTLIRIFDNNYRRKRNWYRSFYEQAAIISNLPYSAAQYHVFHNDARSLPLANRSIQLIVTSPPYINVFNYHQNNRAVMEQLGWNLLAIAQSEIGANRKHRQNRFLTVIQYALDMLAALREMRRLLAENGHLIIVIGRESTIRGVRLGNSRLITALALGGAGFHLASVEERKFLNKFGEIIYEDVLHLAPNSTLPPSNEEFARSLALCVLSDAFQQIDAEAPAGQEILEAISKAHRVQPSPFFDPEHTIGGLL